MRWMMYRWWCEGGDDRAWWVIESVFLCSPDKGFWACLGDLPPAMPRWPETWVSLCNLMLKLRGISRSSAILGSDSNRKDNSLWVTPFIPCERPNVKHAISGYLRLPQPTRNTAYIRDPAFAQRFVLDHWSWATSRPVHNWMGDRLGLPGAVYTRGAQRTT